MIRPPANDNESPYWSQPVLDRAREMSARLEARKRAAAKGRQRSKLESAVSRGHGPDEGCRGPLVATVGNRHGRIRWWDDLGLFSQYGLTFAATVFLLLGIGEILT